jgi:hypothetical protein
VKDPVAILQNPVVRDFLPAVVRPPLPLAPLHDVAAPRAYIPAPMPPFVRNPVARPLWVSWRPALLKPETVSPREVGRGVWSVPATKFPYLEFQLLSSEPPETAPIVGLVAPSGTEVPNPVEAAPLTWRSFYLKAPGEAATLKVQEVKATGWAAFSGPVEVGRLTVWCRAAREQVTLLVILGVALLLPGYAYRR